jgi:ketol-acid reductoisomerase
VVQDFDSFADGMDGDAANLVLIAAAPALDAEHPLEQVGEKLRAMMPWLHNNDQND